MGGAVRVAAAFLVVMALAIPASAADGVFSDVPESDGFHADIRWLADSGITKGCDPPANDRFCPEEPVTRGQMAAFLVRALDLSDTGTADFVDDNDSVFQSDIERLAHARITLGCNPPTNDRFCPEEPVTRGQMAAFLVRALDLSDTGTADFVDDNDSVFQSDIERLAHARITLGCNPPTNNRFCPDDPVTRGQMAAFLHRAFQTVPAATLALFRSTSTDGLPSLDPTALVYVEDSGHLQVFDSPADEQPGFTGVNAFELSLDGDLIRSWSTMGYTPEPAGAAYDPGTGHILISDDDIGAIHRVDPGRDGAFGTGDDDVTSFSTAVFGAYDPEGIALDPETGDVLIVNGGDADDVELFWMVPGANGVIDGVGPAGDDDFTIIDILSVGIIDPEGVVFDPLRRTLLIADRSNPGQVFEITRGGSLVRILMLEGGVTTDLAGIELAPSSTNPALNSLYLADRGDEGTADGVIHEFRLP